MAAVELEGIFQIIKALAGEKLPVYGKGANVRVVNPDQRAAGEMGDDYMDPGRRSVALAAGYAQGRALARGD